jgi:hypothetical protein
MVRFSSSQRGLWVKMKIKGTNLWLQEMIKIWQSRFKTSFYISLEGKTPKRLMQHKTAVTKHTLKRLSSEKSSTCAPSL